MTLQEFVTPEFIAQSIVMIRDSQPNKRPVIVVEGESDQRILKQVLRKFADVFPGNGKWASLGAMKFLPKDAIGSWVLFVVDADFDHLRGVTYSDGVFLTDLHDFECELLRSEALCKVLNEYCSSTRCKSHFGDAANDIFTLAENVRRLLLQQGKKIGRLRYVSELNHFGLKFKRLKDHSRVLKPRSIEVDSQKLIELVLAFGANPGVTTETIERELAKLGTKPIDDWQVCQGHDLVKLFAHGMKRMWGRGTTTEAEVESGLRLGFEEVYFWRTKLGKALYTRLQPDSLISADA